MNSCFGSVSGGCCRLPPLFLQPDHIIDLPLSLTGGAESAKWLVQLAPLWDSQHFALSSETAGLEVLEVRLLGSQQMGSIWSAWRWTSSSWFWQNAYLRFLGRWMKSLCIVVLPEQKDRNPVYSETGRTRYGTRIHWRSGLDALLHPDSLGTSSQKELDVCCK